ncbi:putative membrane protein [Frankia sp. AiPs1]|uniref:low temperature requirement protein A n=1 Tax=Frankia sp. AiPa1 TaxID=573492 RepID=UPI00202B9030|nr:low temperature requirement protein A [Frankia sp. AiPa1]MCL9759149.1 low temperature requirement protein A [Frankia sp. AiPa1]
MRPRSVTEHHRVSTPLELLVDLSFVVAIAQASTKLHHALSEGHVGTGVAAYVGVFFAVWWAWMNFTWFGSAFDIDDVPYRIATLVQVAGVLILASGVPRAFDDHDFAIVTLGYAVMRCGLVAQWLRAARGAGQDGVSQDGPDGQPEPEGQSRPDGRPRPALAAGTAGPIDNDVHDVPTGSRAARTYASGISLCMIGWAGLLFLPDAVWAPAFAVMVLAELAVPILAERRDLTPWHPHHIAERYGLFTIIVLGESILSATVAVQTALDDHDASAALFAVACGGLLIVFAMWWLYFARPAHEFLVSSRVAFTWGYGHYFVFAAAAAVGAGLAAGVDQATHHAKLDALATGATVTVPVAIFLLAVALLHLRPARADPRPVRTPDPGPAQSRRTAALVGMAALAVLATTTFGLLSSGAAVLATGGVLAMLIAAAEVVGWESSRPAAEPGGSHRH